MRVEHRTEIGRPVVEVFPFVRDPDRLASWVETMVEGRLESAGPAAAGQPFVHVYEEDGRRREVRGEILVLEDGRRCTLGLSGDGFQARIDYRFEDLGGRTGIHQVSDIEFSGLLRRLLTPVLRRGASRRLRRNYERLRRMVEDGP